MVLINEIIKIRKKIKFSRKKINNQKIEKNNKKMSNQNNCKLMILKYNKMT